jgi:hypothetical protein
MAAAIGSKMTSGKAIKVNPMKSFFALLITMLLGASAFGQQSLGEIARQNRNKKKPSSVVNLSDDNMHRTIAPDAQDAKADDSSAATADKDKDAAAKDDKDNKDKKTGSAEAEKDKKEQIQKNIDAQKKEIGDLQRELDIMQREQKLRAAAYYGDAGTMLRDSARYAEDSKKQQDDIDSKKQALDAAQQKLADLQEQARKAGMGASATE